METRQAPEELNGSAMMRLLQLAQYEIEAADGTVVAHPTVAAPQVAPHRYVYDESRFVWKREDLGDAA